MKRRQHLIQKVKRFGNKYYTFPAGSLSLPFPLSPSLPPCFTKSTNLSLPSVTSVCHQFEVVTQVRILGLTISNDLKWNAHITNLIKKVNKRFYLIVQLKRAKVPAHDIITFYCTCIRQVLEYCCQVYHYVYQTTSPMLLNAFKSELCLLFFPTQTTTTA